MARRDALLRLNKTLTARRNELRKRLGTDLAELGSMKMTSADVADQYLTILLEGIST